MDGAKNCMKKLMLLSLLIFCTSAWADLNSQKVQLKKTRIEFGKCLKQQREDLNDLIRALENYEIDFQTNHPDIANGEYYYGRKDIDSHTQDQWNWWYKPYRQIWDEWVPIKESVSALDTAKATNMRSGSKVSNLIKTGALDLMASREALIDEESRLIQLPEIYNKMRYDLDTSIKYGLRPANLKNCISLAQAWDKLEAELADEQINQEIPH